MYLPPHVKSALLSLRQSILALPWVERVLLFGSFAKGSWGRQSDVDLAVFVRRGTPCGLAEYRVLCRFCRGLDLDIQIQVFSVAELDDPCGIVEEIAQHGYDLLLLTS